MLMAIDSLMHDWGFFCIFSQSKIEKKKQVEGYYM